MRSGQTTGLTRNTGSVLMDDEGAQGQQEFFDKTGVITPAVDLFDTSASAEALSLSTILPCRRSGRCAR